MELTEDGDWIVTKAVGTDIARQGRTVPEALATLAGFLAIPTEAPELPAEGVPEEPAVLEPDAPLFDGEYARWRISVSPSVPP